MVAAIRPASHSAAARFACGSHVEVPLDFKRRWLTEKLHQRCHQPEPVLLEVQRENLLDPWADQILDARPRQGQFVRRLGSMHRLPSPGYQRAPWA